MDVGSVLVCFLVLALTGKEILCFSVCLRAFRQFEMIPLGFILSIVHVGFVVFDVSGISK